MWVRKGLNDRLVQSRRSVRQAADYTMGWALFVWLGLDSLVHTYICTHGHT